MRHLHMPGQAACAALLLVLLATSCCAQSYMTITPLQGYFNGNSVYYILTDVSDQALATSLNANYTPLLANALANTYIQYAYYVTNFPQGLIFTAQWPAGYNGGGSYMPVWVLQTVTWMSGTPVVLKSPAQIAAQGSKVRVRRTRIVVDASILINSTGASIPQGRVSGTPPALTIALPVYGVYVDGLPYRMLRLDFSNASEAAVYGGTWSPMLGKFDILRAKGLPMAWQDVYSLWTTPPVGQLPVARQALVPFGPGNANPNYSPLMVEWAVRSPSPAGPVYTSYADILAAALPLSRTSYWINEPIIGP